jgi:site-specific recombinase XerD
MGQITRDFCKGINILPICFHDLRATFITQMLNNGVALSKVMAIVGHSSLKTTQGYLRLCGKDVEGATEELRITLPDISKSEGKVIDFRR